MYNISDWIALYQDLPGIGISQSNTVEGVCDRPYAGKSFAKVELKFEKSDEFIFSSMLNSDDYKSLSTSGSLDKWIYGIFVGVLDVALVRPIRPVSLFKCSVISISYHEVFSHMTAFQLAARDATTKFLTEQPNIHF